MKRIGLSNYTEHVLDFQNELLLEKIFLLKKIFVSFLVITVVMTEVVGK